MMPTHRPLRMRALVLAFAFAGLATPAAASEIRSWTDANGVRHFEASGSSRGGTAAVFYKYRDKHGAIAYTNVRPRGRVFDVVRVNIDGCYACNTRSRVNFDTTRLNLDAYDAEIAAAATEYGVDPALVRAVIHAESAFNKDALSRKGAQGLMQLMPGTADMYGVMDAFDPDQNIQAGTAHLAMLLQKYRGDITLATAAYNAGEGAVARYGGVPPFAETRVYVERVATLHRRYQGSLGSSSGTALASP
jgi:membrane-bound lytic murein transglycosylase B